MAARRAVPSPDSPVEEWVAWLKETAAVFSMMPDRELGLHLAKQTLFTAKALE